MLNSVFHFRLVFTLLVGRIKIIKFLPHFVAFVLLFVFCFSFFPAPQLQWPGFILRLTLATIYELVWLLNFTHKYFTHEFKSDFIFCFMATVTLFIPFFNLYYLTIGFRLVASTSDYIFL